MPDIPIVYHFNVKIVNLSQDKKLSVGNIVDMQERYFARGSGVVLIFDQNEIVMDYAQGDMVSAEIYVDRLKVQAKDGKLKFNGKIARFLTFSNEENGQQIAKFHLRINR